MFEVVSRNVLVWSDVVPFDFILRLHSMFWLILTDFVWCLMSDLWSWFMLIHMMHLLRSIPLIIPLMFHLSMPYHLLIYIPFDVVIVSHVMVERKKGSNRSLNIKKFPHCTIRKFRDQRSDWGVVYDRLGGGESDRKSLTTCRYDVRRCDDVVLHWYYEHSRGFTLVRGQKRVMGGGGSRGSVVF